MRHSYYGKKLSRSANERRSLRRNLMKSMILHGKIKTTKAKAQAVRGELEKLITKAKKGTEAMRRDILSSLTDKTITNQLMEMSKTQFGNRNSGYTRIVKIGTRLGDSTEMVVLSFVDEKVETEVIQPGKEKNKTKIKETKIEETKETKAKRVTKKKKV